MSISEAPSLSATLCEWIEPALREIAGQDPLGLQTITTDRILPGLLPGVLALSVRARYFSIYSFLIRRYSQRGARADNTGLDEFIRRREFELCVAANLCPRCEAESVIGNLVGRPAAAARPGAYARRNSIRTELGGYGLYYRSPMEELGLIARRGSALIGDEPIPVDVLQKSERAQRIADLFEEAIADTRWYREWMHGVDPIPAEVLEELGEAACPCRLDVHPLEQAALGELFLTAASPQREEPAEHRRRAFGLLLALGSADPDALVDDTAFRDAAISSFLADPGGQGPAAEARARWAAVAMRECVQEPLASIWVAFCRAGLATQPYDGLRRDELDHLVRHELMGTGEVELAGAVIRTHPDAEAVAWLGEVEAIASVLSWEQLRSAAAEASDALTALACFLTLCMRVPDGPSVSVAWREVARVDGERQPGLAGTASLVRRQLATEPSVGSLMRWVIDNFIIAVHETVAMSKLPEATFRFVWEPGQRLRFIDNGIWRFDVSGLRRDALSSLSYDLGWWNWVNESTPGVSDTGQAVVSRVFES